MLSKTFDIDKKLFTLGELLPIVKGLNRKLLLMNLAKIFN